MSVSEKIWQGETGPPACPRVSSPPTAPVAAPGDVVPHFVRCGLGSRFPTGAGRPGRVSCSDGASVSLGAWGVGGGGWRQRLHYLGAHSLKPHSLLAPRKLTTPGWPGAHADLHTSVSTGVWPSTHMSPAVFARLRDAHVAATPLSSQGWRGHTSLRLPPCHALAREPQAQGRRRTKRPGPGWDPAGWPLPISSRPEFWTSAWAPGATPHLGGTTPCQPWGASPCGSLGEAQNLQRELRNPVAFCDPEATGLGCHAAAGCLGRAPFVCAPFEHDWGEGGRGCLCGHLGEGYRKWGVARQRHLESGGSSAFVRSRSWDVSVQAGRGALRQFLSGRGGVTASLLLCLGRVVRAWVLGSQGTRVFSSA